MGPGRPLSGCLHRPEFTADRVDAAPTYDLSYLESVLGEHFLSEGGETCSIPIRQANTG